MRLVNAFVRADFEAEQFEAANEDSATNSMRAMQFMTNLIPVMLKITLPRLRAGPLKAFARSLAGVGRAHSPTALSPQREQRTVANTRKTRSPLKELPLRMPGHSIQDEIERIHENKALLPFSITVAHILIAGLEWWL